MAHNIFRAAGATGVEGLLDAARGPLHPAAAQTLVGLDVDLGRITTRGSLERGLEYALGRLSYRIVQSGII